MAELKVLSVAVLLFLPHPLFKIHDILHDIHSADADFEVHPHTVAVKKELRLQPDLSIDISLNNRKRLFQRLFPEQLRELLGCLSFDPLSNTRNLRQARLRISLTVLTLVLQICQVQRYTVLAKPVITKISRTVTEFTLQFSGIMIQIQTRIVAFSSAPQYLGCRMITFAHMKDFQVFYITISIEHCPTLIRLCIAEFHDIPI